MPLLHLDSTPADPALMLQRCNAPLLWNPAHGRPADGQVEMRSTPEGMIPMLLPQPYKSKRYMGISMFVPACDQRIFDAAHAQLGANDYGCATSVANTPLPEHLQLVNDHPFTLRLFGQQERTMVGQHYTLFASMEMPVSVFEQRYNELLATFQPRQMRAMGAAAALSSLIDPHVMPADSCSAAAVMALEDLASTTSDPHTRLFATLFALDMRACNTDFEDVLQGCGNRAALIAVALDQFVVRDPLLREAAYDAQEALAGELPSYKPQWCKYEPFWQVHPFQFKGTCNDEAYDSAVKVCAPGFRGDQKLKSKVCAYATELFKELASSAYEVDVRKVSFKHDGLTFVVECLKPGPSSSGGSGSGSRTAPSNGSGSGPSCCSRSAPVSGGGSGSVPSNGGGSGSADPSCGGIGLGPSNGDGYGSGPPSSNGGSQG
mmetsp:Transcript_8086/g.17302  ORF Transcript_8086/g.17302 Transcript_8086/m.17302 type:complete len:433 (+) Transcript_8086:285-1583(+)|eukprot:CAMPEP_0202896370 /NCGR_PEP_ID=MMETSP1392-20130828/5393_1 /ASSEMBLY_ACC=CAM_ASM_000868 /TAXON_ID=225041 /ORGANISM="Chlamydomonas chlamydogama, Strain SAG 11-48b" /LENGTH=432 /DNA_ID=CAMNT_0049581711 /DNA_START=174 /DNA_END=1472 /DNA_ORIENTATION=-